MEKQTAIVILKALNQILFTIGELRHQTPVYGRLECLKEAREEVYAETRRLEKQKQ